MSRCRFGCYRPLVGLLVLALLAWPALAHRLSPAYLAFTEQTPGVFAVEWKASIPGGLADVLEPRVPAGCTLDGAMRTYLVGDARLRQGTLACEQGLAGRELGVDGLAATDTDVLFRVGYLDGSSFTHRLVPTEPVVTIPAKAGAAGVAATYLVLGIEHILLGIDHLLFVLALLLIVRGIGRLIATITAFTVAHSVTLGAATLGLANPPSAPVEAVIALSILFLATELARRDSAHGAACEDLTSRFPWLVAFSFGLLHGFGFAGALADVGLPQHAVPLALLFFNLGVEVGQLIFVAAALGAVWLWRRASLPVPAAWQRVTAYAIGSIAAFWVIERTAAIF